MANVSRTKKAGNDGTIVGALRNGVLGLDQLPLAGKVYTQSQAADLVQGRIDAGAAVLKAKAEWVAAIAAYEAIDKQVDIAVRDLRNVVIGACGEDSPKMAAFAFAPRKRRVFTQEQIAAIVKKRNATRARRGTMGRNQKKAIKGVVPVAAVAAEPVVATAGAAAVSTGSPADTAAIAASPAVLVALAGAAVQAAPGGTSQAQAAAHTAAAHTAAAEGSAGAVTVAPASSTGKPSSSG